MTPREVSWSMIISMKRICGVVRLRSLRNCEKAVWATRGLAGVLGHSGAGFGFAGSTGVVERSVVGGKMGRVCGDQCPPGGRFRLTADDNFGVSQGRPHL